MASQTFSGARAQFSIDGALVGFAGGVSGEETIEYTPIDVLNLLEVREHVPVAYRTSLNAQIFRVVGQSLKARKIMPVQEDIITSGDLEATIVDSVTAATVARVTGVRCSGTSYDIGARGVVQENVTFVAIRMKDEYEEPA